jgi:hypothetical protein
MQVNKSKQLKGMIVHHFVTAQVPRMSRSDLLKKLWPFYEHVSELDEVLKVFQEVGMIVFVCGMYVMPKAQIDEYRRLFTKKKENANED